MLLTIILIFSIIVNVVLSYLLLRAVKRMFQYDDVFQYIVGDIEVNLGQFSKMASSSVLGGDAEIQIAHKNMMIMARRLDEITRRMEETSGLRLRSKPKFSKPPQVA